MVDIRQPYTVRQRRQPGSPASVFSPAPDERADNLTEHFFGSCAILRTLDVFEATDLEGE